MPLVLMHQHTAAATTTTIRLLVGEELTPNLSDFGGIPESPQYQEYQQHHIHPIVTVTETTAAPSIG